MAPWFNDPTSPPNETAEARKPSDNKRTLVVGENGPGRRRQAKGGVREHHAEVKVEGDTGPVPERHRVYHRVAGATGAEVCASRGHHTEYTKQPCHW